MGERQLVFPQGNEEICREEVVESQGAVSESRQIDLQKERRVRTLSVTACGQTGHQAGDKERDLMGQVIR